MEGCRNTLLMMVVFGMSVNYGKIVSDALKKDAFSRKSLPIICIIVLVAAPILTFILSFIFGVPFGIPTFLLLLLILLVLPIFWILTLFLGGIVIKQAGEDARDKCISFKESFQFVKNKMLSLVCAGILIAFIRSVINTSISNIPYVGGLFNLIVSILGLIFSIFVELLVFVTYPYIILGEKGAIDAISASAHHFFEKKLQVFIIWLIESVITLVITFIFAIPFITIILPFILSHFHLEKLPHPHLFSPICLAGSVIILSIGIAIALVFSYAVTARYYISAIGGTDE